MGYPLIDRDPFHSMSNSFLPILIKVFRKSMRNRCSGAPLPLGKFSSFLNFAFHDKETTNYFYELPNSIFLILPSRRQYVWCVCQLDAKHLLFLPVFVVSGNWSKLSTEEKAFSTIALVLILTNPFFLQFLVEKFIKKLRLAKIIFLVSTI